MGKIHSIIRFIVGYCCQNFAMHVLSENILLRGELIRNTFDVGRVTVQEYMGTYQDNSGKLLILIRFTEYVDKILRFIHSANGNF